MMNYEKELAEIMLGESLSNDDVKKAVELSNSIRRYGAYSPDVVLIIHKIYDKVEERYDELWKVEQPTESEVEEFVAANTWLQWNARYNPNKKIINPVKTEKFKKKPNDDVFTLNSWKKIVDSGGFIDYDGWGYVIIDNYQTDTCIYPSHYLANPEIFDQLVGKVKILWMNR